MILLLVEYSLTVSPDDKLIDSQKRKLIELSAGVGDPRFHKVILLSILIYFSEERTREFRRYLLVGKNVLNMQKKRKSSNLEKRKRKKDSCIDDK